MVSQHLERICSSKNFITFVVAYAVFVVSGSILAAWNVCVNGTLQDQFIFAVIVPVMPFTLHDQVGISQGSVQYWVSILLAVYGAASTVAAPLWGWLTDKVGSRRIPFLIGLIIIIGATLMIWLGNNIAVQVIGRALQGFASCVVWVTGLALIADAVGPEHVGEYTSYLGIGMMVGSLLGPLLGGVVLAESGTNAVYGMTMGVLFLDIVLRLLAIEKRSPREITNEASGPELSDDPANRTPASTDDRVAQPSLSNIEKGHSTTDISDSKASFNSACDPSKAFAPPSPKTRHLPAVLTLLTSPRLLSALWSTLVVGLVFAGLEGVIPLQVNATFGWTSIGAGLIFLPITIPAFLGPLIGRFCDKYGPRLPVAIGFLLLCPFLTLLRLVDHNSLNQKVLLSALLALQGTCFTLTLDPLIAEVSYVVYEKARLDPLRYGSATKASAQAFGLFKCAYSVGNTVGPVISGLIRDHSGWGTTTWVLGLFCAVTSVPAALWCGGWWLASDARWKKE